MQYQVHAVFRGFQGPVNAVAISKDTRLLASGGECPVNKMIERKLTTWVQGDSEEVKIWDLDEQKEICTLSDNLGRWGQITTIKWLENVANSYTVCFGTGRGWILIYCKPKETVRASARSLF